MTAVGPNRDLHLNRKPAIEFHEHIDSAPKQYTFSSQKLKQDHNSTHFRTTISPNFITSKLLVTDYNMAIPFKEALLRLENRRVKATRPLIPPQILQEELPLCVSHSISLECF